MSDPAAISADVSRPAEPRGWPSNDPPRVPKDLLDALSAAFPDRGPRPDAFDRDIWIACGRRQVIEFLLVKYQQQNAKRT